MTYNYEKPHELQGVQFSGSADVDPRTPMLRALGLFIMNYAKVETAIQMYARRLIGINDDQARILLSGLRVHDVVSRISLLLLKTQRSEPEREEFRDLSEHLTTITNARDSLVHHGTTFVANDRVLSHKAFVSRDSNKFPSQEFTLEQLNALVDDCAFMFIRFTAILEPQLWEIGNTALLKEEAYQPWRY